MTPEKHARWKRLLEQARDVPRAELPQFLASRTGEDQDLVPSLRELLGVERNQVFFDHTRARTPPPLPLVPHVEVPAPARIGEYELLERLGAGGMGSVYRARQRTPERIVAIKMLHPWLVSTASLERFRFEAQALASLKHRSIPPVFTIGQHEGAVFFAMELVTGPSLTDWVKLRGASLAERVALLVAICDAIHHAHLRGFVHRDLKPDNIRVTDDGTPQVLDFGISAGLGAHAEVAGTPAYMSPEQLEPGAPVDVRSDVYSLGVIAFELLLGHLPEEPPGTSPATLQAFKRAPSPRLLSLAPRLGSQLDHIVARALEPTPERRYASAAELGDDLQRFLSYQPVTAYPGGRLYRLGRFIRRNRLLSLAATCIVLALTLGAAISLAQSLAAERARALAATEARRAKASLAFLNSVLQTGGPGEDGERGATIGAALDRAAAKLPDAHLDPHVEAVVRASLANTYVGVGEWKNAAQQAHLALAAYTSNHLEEDEDLGEVYRIVTQVYEEVGDTTAAVQAARRALALEERFHGASAHTHLTNSLHVAAIALRDAGQVEAALELHRRAVALERVHAQLVSDTGDLSDMLDQLGVTLVSIGRYEEAELAHREALTLNLARYGPAHQNVATNYNHLANLEFDRGNLEAAHALLQRSVELRRPILGADHVRLAYAGALMARIELAQGQLQAADDDETETLRIAERSYGAQFGRYAQLSGPRVLTWLAQGRTGEALELSQRLLDVTAARFGARHPVTAEASSNHALALLASGQTEAAVTELTEAVEVLTRVYGERPRVSREARARLDQALAARSAHPLE